MGRTRTLEKNVLALNGRDFAKQEQQQQAVIRDDSTDWSEIDTNFRTQLSLSDCFNLIKSKFYFSK